MEEHHRDDMLDLSQRIANLTSPIRKQLLETFTKPSLPPPTEETQARSPKSPILDTSTKPHPLHPLT